MSEEYERIQELEAQLESTTKERDAALYEVEEYKTDRDARDNALEEIAEITRRFL